VTAQPAGDRPDEESRLRHLFIVTYGRSGSTLLQGVLNSIPGYLIRGENDGAVYHLHQFHSACVGKKRRLRKRFELPLDSTNPHFGLDEFPANVSLRMLRRLVTSTVLRPEEDTRVTGFKEIRWYQEDLPAYVDFLRALFPGARFLVNTRDHAAVLQSGWWPDKPRDGRLERMESAILDVAESLGDAAYRVHFDDYTADPAVLRGLFHWLGEDFDETRVRAVLGVRHSV
jgi:hypothetical protein